MSKLFSNCLFDSYCVRGPLIVALKIDPRGKRLATSPSMGDEGFYLWKTLSITTITTTMKEADRRLNYKFH